MKRKSSHDSLTGKELAEMILRLMEKIHMDMKHSELIEMLQKIDETCQNVRDEW